VPLQRRLSTAARVPKVLQKGGTSVVDMQGGIYVWVEGSELLYDLGGYACEGQGLQAACSTTDVAGFQQ
jgi:hypothetical protein